jgi:4-hydroxythreonine-4-phosphate dehydrogenase
MPILAVTPGDPSGIGPEIVWKTIQEGSLKKSGFHLLCVGARQPFQRLGAPIVDATLDPNGLPLTPPPSRKPFVWLLPAPTKPPKKGIHLEGFQSGWSIEVATRLVLENKASALVTGPISKERLQRGGYPYSGHTDLLADLCGVKNVTMMLANEKLRISLVTTHISLRDVPDALNRERIRRAILHTADHVRRWWGIRRPRIAVAALNPHAGESGLFGSEEIRVIEPEVRALNKKAAGKYILFGPLPSDTLFAHHVMALKERPHGLYDAVVCMYHDQGLIPVKLLDFPKTVNVTLGLPIVRTSVDHGVAFDIAWKDQADPSSFKSAVGLAMEIIRRRGKNGS